MGQLKLQILQAVSIEIPNTWKLLYGDDNQLTEPLNIIGNISENTQQSQW